MKLAFANVTREMKYSHFFWSTSSLNYISDGHLEVAPTMSDILDIFFEVNMEFKWRVNQLINLHRIHLIIMRMGSCVSSVSLSGHSGLLELVREVGNSYVLTISL